MRPRLFQMHVQLRLLAMAFIKKKKDNDADASAPEATKKGINAAAKKTTDARRIAEAAKCTATSARIDVKKRCRGSSISTKCCIVFIKIGR
mmetsp:Transcript_16979/g.20823  ORF Transcript_16979/g.20823 Transcript_16979/m.20823 type:complete len:91 (-) Transcript_16979:477-749(-)